MTLMTSRFICVAVIGGVALVIGLVSPSTPGAYEMNRNRLDLTPPLALSQSDVQILVERLGATDFFPNAQVLSAETTEGVAPAIPTIEESQPEEAAYSPIIRALVRREAQWRLYTAGKENLIMVFAPGEEIFDGWLISRIGPRTLELERDGQHQKIDVFLPDTAE